MAKPIVIIYLPEFVKENQANEIHQRMVETMTDYYCFAFPKPKITAPEFEVFYEKDFTEIKFEELKKLIVDIVTSITNKQPTV